MEFNSIELNSSNQVKSAQLNSGEFNSTELKRTQVNPIHMNSSELNLTLRKVLCAKYFAQSALRNVLYAPYVALSTFAQNWSAQKIVFICFRQELAWKAQGTRLRGFPKEPRLGWAWSKPLIT